jgi:periplasmic divalent cation tolerance protein
MERDGSDANANSFRVAMCTTAPGDADGIARALVDEHLAACVNIIPVRSCYLWEGKLNLEGEELLIIKTEQSMVEQLMSRINELHSYKVPEIIVLPIVVGYPPYLHWITQSLG